MSLENLIRFTEAVNTAPALQKELAAIREPRALMRRAVQMAAERGYDFTEEELAARARAVRAREGELNDEELAAVSGGATMAEYGLLLSLIAVVCMNSEPVRTR
jgi:predicted ribosomally synthesized peptide with nif11-like leader